MFIFHHNDDDGRCAAAIIYNEIGMDRMMPANNCIEYSHGMKMPDIDMDTIRDNDLIFIVDLALDDVIYGLIEKIYNAKPNCTIVHIDHHKTTLDYVRSLEVKYLGCYDGVAYGSMHTFYRMGISASMLCWAYVCMSEEDRAKIGQQDDPFDFTETYSHIGVNFGKPTYREIRIPMVVRFINDWDVWNHKISGTTEFHYGFSMETDKHPASKTWRDILYSSNDMLIDGKYVRPGSFILKYVKSENEHLMKHAFTWIIDGNTVLCLNGSGSSMVFGDKIKEYPAVCLFSYHGEKGMWSYSMYSDAETGIDVSEICKKNGGGGHAHAAGWTSPQLFFDEKWL